MNDFYRNFGKRIFDLVVAVPALLVFSPVIILIIILLYLTGHRRVFFVQQRVGSQDRIFYLLKFRTMTETTDSSGQLLPDKERLTKFGAALRKTSLDELPQLINVIKGDMSLIGPRPLLVQYLPLYNATQKKRHLVRPGITGLAQVSGRNSISWEQKFEFDVEYVSNLSFKLDMRIFWLTIRNIVKAEGISQDGQATAAPFLGNGNRQSGNGNRQK